MSRDSLGVSLIDCLLFFPDVCHVEMILSHKLLGLCIHIGHSFLHKFIIIMRSAPLVKNQSNLVGSNVGLHQLLFLEQSLHSSETSASVTGRELGLHSIQPEVQVTHRLR